jgi:hypothetical protein
MRMLNSTTLNIDRKTGTVQGGTLQYEITRSLFAKRKYCVRACDTHVCVMRTLTYLAKLLYLYNSTIIALIDNVLAKIELL